MWMHIVCPNIQIVCPDCSRWLRQALHLKAGLVCRVGWVQTTGFHFLDAELISRDYFL